MIKVRLFLFVFVLLQSIVLNGQEVKEAFSSIPQTDSVKEIETIIKSYPDVIKYKQSDNRNILFEVSNSRFQIFEVLLKNGANPNEKDDMGWTPLTYNTSNYDLFVLFQKYGGKIVESHNERTDYISRLIFDYTVGNQEEAFKIIEAVLSAEDLDLNKIYDNGLALGHMVIINYLTYADDTNFDQLLHLLMSYGLTFNRQVEKNFSTKNYPFKIIKGDSCFDIIRKVSEHEFYNGRALSHIEENCSN